jgi:hypothetical protein
LPHQTCTDRNAAMLSDEKERMALKDWVVPKLEKMSASIFLFCDATNKVSAEADAGLLAEYVLALIAAEDSEEGVRKNCIESLSDFLQDRESSSTSSGAFINIAQTPSPSRPSCLLPSNLNRSFLNPHPRDPPPHLDSRLFLPPHCPPKRCLSTLQPDPQRPQDHRYVYLDWEAM